MPGFVSVCRWMFVDGSPNPSGIWAFVAVGGRGGGRYWREMDGMWVRQFSREGEMDG